MIVAACGTVSSVAADTGKDLPVPFVEVISHSVEAAVAASKTKRIGVLATPATIKSHAHREKIRALCPGAAVVETAAPLLVSLAEEGWYQTDNEIARLTVKEYLRDMAAGGVDTLILGCTHFPVFSDLIREFMPETGLIDMGAAAARYIKKTLAERDAANLPANKAEHLFFVSDKPVTFRKTVKIFLGDCSNDIKIDQVDVEQI